MILIIFLIVFDKLRQHSIIVWTLLANLVFPPTPCQKGVTLWCSMEFIVKESRKVWIPNHPTHGYRPGRRATCAYIYTLICPMTHQYLPVKQIPPGTVG